MVRLQTFILQHLSSLLSLLPCLYDEFVARFLKVGLPKSLMFSSRRKIPALPEDPNSQPLVMPYFAFGPYCLFWILDLIGAFKFIHVHMHRKETC